MEPDPQPAPPPKRGQAMLSKKGYYDLEARLRESFDEAAVARVLAAVREVLAFDPAVSRYTAKSLEQTRAWRARRKAARAQPA